MRNKIIYNEEQLGTQILKTGYENGYTFYETLLVAKLFRHTEKRDARWLRAGIVDFIREKDPIFSGHSRFHMVKSLIKYSTNPYVDTGSVYITTSEITRIKDLKNFKWQKIALSVLLIAKRKTNKGTINIRSFRDIKAIVGNKISRSDILVCLYEMQKRGMVNGHDKHKLDGTIDVWYKVGFIDTSDDNIAISITTDTEAKMLPKTYEKYCGGALGYCLCGNEFIRKNNYQRLCPECAAKRKHVRIHNGLQGYESYNGRE